MPKLIVDCDEKWPVYGLEVPEEGEESNCEIPEELYKFYLITMINYCKIQKQLKEYYEENERNIVEKSYIRHPKSSTINTAYHSVGTETSE